MPNLSSLEFLIGEAVSGIFRNRIMSVAAIVTAAVSLAVCAGFAVTALSVHHACEALPRQMDMAVYVKRGIPRDQVMALGETLKKKPGVASVAFVSKEQGWQDLKKSLGTEVSMNDVVGNPVLDTFRLRMSDPARGKQLQSEIAKLPPVDSVQGQQEYVDTFLKTSRAAAGVGVFLTIVLFLGSAFIVGNTIRLGIYARRREVAIMRLVGARPSFIRLPFLIEGMLLAGFGGALAAVIIALAGDYLTTLTSQLPTVTKYFQSGVAGWQLSLTLLASGLVLGAFSSVLSVRRYLNEGPYERTRP